MDADHGGVDEAANICLSEELTPVCEGHPVDVNK